MEIINKTFEFKLEGTPVNGIVKSISDEDLSTITNLDVEKYSGSVFKAVILTVPELEAPYFEKDTTKVYIVGYEEREGQIGSIESGEFKPYEGEDIITRTIAKNILEVLMLNPSTGHFTVK